MPRRRDNRWLKTPRRRSKNRSKRPNRRAGGPSMSRRALSSRHHIRLQSISRRLRRRELRDLPEESLSIRSRGRRNLSSRSARTDFRPWPRSLLSKSKSLKIVNINPGRGRRRTLPNGTFNVNSQWGVPRKAICAVNGRGRRSPHDPLKPAITKSPGKRVNLNRPTQLVTKLFDLLGNIIRRETQNKVRRERILCKRLLDSGKLIIFDPQGPGTLLIESSKVVHRGHNSLNLRERHRSTFRLKPYVFELSSVLKRGINDKTIGPRKLKKLLSILRKRANEA